MVHHDPASAAVRVMTSLDLEPAPWQLDVLRGNHARLLLNCCRQAGKSTVVALHALLHAVYSNNLLVLLLSPSFRQSTELFGIVGRFYERMGQPCRKRYVADELALTNQSRIVSLPCSEETIRGYSNVGLLIIDKASRVPDDLYLAVRPMLAASGGRLICMSTPWGKRGFFYEAWTQGGDDWHRIEVRAQQVPHLKPETVAQDRRCMRASTFAREYECSFEAPEGVVYPELLQCVVSALPPALAEAAAFFFPAGGGAAPALAARSARPPGAEGVQRVGGIDFGFRNPFAAVWCLQDRDDVLWVVGEHYCRERPLSHNATRLPRKVTWYADPAGANERAELRCAGFDVRQGINAICPGIAAVTARIQTGRLKVLAGACPNLVSEAGLYRYDPDSKQRNAETPIDEHNHCLGALRYMVTRIDIRKMARADSKRTDAADAAADGAAAPQPPAKRKPKPWLRYDNEALWTPLNY